MSYEEIKLRNSLHEHQQEIARLRAAIAEANASSKEWERIAEKQLAQLVKMREALEHWVGADCDCEFCVVGRAALAQPLSPQPEAER